MSDAENPYQAPEAQEPEEIILTDDTEFLISGREILCRDVVTLPRVCIARGTSEDLEERQRSLRTTTVSFLLVVLPFIVLLFVFPAAVCPALVIFSLLWALVMQLPGSIKIPGTATTTVTWYVSRAYRQRCRMIQWIVRGTIFVATFSAGAFVAYVESTVRENALTNALLAGLATGGVAGLLSLALKMERTFRCTGTRWRGPYKGLFVLTGHSRQFSETVERMIHSGF